jgi:hypothetical protein
LTDIGCNWDGHQIELQQMSNRTTTYIRQNCDGVRQNFDGRKKNCDRCRMELQQMSDKTTSDVGQNYDGRWTKLQRMSDETTMNVEQNYDKRQTKLQQTSDGTNRQTNDDYVDNDVVDRSMSMSFVTMACKRKKRNFFLLFHVFLIFFFFFFFQSCYKGYSLHDCKFKKPCVCVCACSQDLKLVVKLFLEVLAPSSLRSSGIQNFTSCSFFSMSFLPRLHCC